MNAYQDFVAARPVVEPPDQDELDAVWARVVGELTGSPPTTETSPAMRLAVRPSGMTRARLRDVPSHRAVSRRRPLVLIAAAACVVLLVALIAIVARPDDGATRLDETPPSTPASSWQTFPAAPIEPRSQAALVATDDGIFVWGGGTTDRTLSDGAYYDADSNAWEVLPDAPFAGGTGFGLAAWTGAEVLVLSSETPAAAAAFDPQSFTWRSLPSPVGTGSSGAARLLTVGESVALVDRSTVELFDLSSETWSSPLDIGNVGPTTDPDRVVLADGTASDGLIAVATRALAPCAPGIVHIVNVASQVVTDVPLPDNGWWPSDLVGIDGGRFLAFGSNVCGENQPLPAPRAFVVAGTGRAATEVAAPPYSPNGAAPPPTLWTGELVVGLTADGRLAAYSPASDDWAVGDALVDVVEGAESRQIDATPIVWFDDAVIAVWPSFVTDLPGATLCCTAHDEAWSSAVPRPLAPLITITPTLPDSVV